MKLVIMFFGVLHQKILTVQRRSFNWQLILGLAYLIVDFYGHIRNYVMNVGLSCLQDLFANCKTSYQELPIITIYKAFIRSHLVYDDILYDEVYNTSY